MGNLSLFVPILNSLLLHLVPAICRIQRTNHVESLAETELMYDGACIPKALSSGGGVGDFTASGHLIKSKSINPGTKRSR